MQQTTLENKTIFCRDNLEVMRGLNSDSIDLVYLDPPFNKKKVFAAPVESSANGASFRDIFRQEDVEDGWADALRNANQSLASYLDSVEKIGYSYNKYYLVYMAIRMLEIHRIVKPTGSVYLHCDPTMSHYLKVMMDGIFGEHNFRNEIIWQRDSAGRGAKKTSHQFSRNIDVILFYAKGKNNFFKQPYSDKLEHKQLKEFRYSEKDGRKYKIVTLGDYSERSKQHFRENDLLHTTSTGKEYKKYYLDEFKMAIGGVWNDIANLSHGRNKEYLQYPTQKPLALLKRIISASSREGDVVLDPFCGCATTCVAADKLKRRWIGIDISKKAYEMVQVRLAKELESEGSVFNKEEVVFRTDIPRRTDRSENR